VGRRSGFEGGIDMNVGGRNEEGTKVELRRDEKGPPLFHLPTDGDNQNFLGGRQADHLLPSTARPQLDPHPLISRPRNAKPTDSRAHQTSSLPPSPSSPLTLTSSHHAHLTLSSIPPLLSLPPSRVRHVAERSPRSTRTWRCPSIRLLSIDLRFLSSASLRPPWNPYRLGSNLISSTATVLSACHAF